MIPLKTIEELIAKHSSIEKDLSSGILDNKLFAEKSKSIQILMKLWAMLKIIFLTKLKEELEKILNDNADEELKKMAELELKHLENQHELNEKIKIIFVTKR